MGNCCMKETPNKNNNKKESGMFTWLRKTLLFSKPDVNEYKL